jgi:phthiocerol/phenolphthiocerol synthesis type-I polyketide synthase E
MSETSGMDVAIIGISCRFPGAANKDEFWENLWSGRDVVKRFEDEELIISGVSIDDVLDPDRVKAGPALDGVYDFDPAFFNIPETEAVVLDPQQRLFLSCAWEAFEDAGYVPDDYMGSVGVFAGATHNTYLFRELWPAFERFAKQLGEPFVIMANQADFLPTRVSYKLNLKGPSVSVSTACSTSLVATHYACRSLLTGECDLALAGGVAISFPEGIGYRRYGENNGSISPDGFCRPFDHRGQGMVPANGVGVALLKRLEDALEDRDHIYAVIRGSAINNDGARKVGFLAPSVEGQAEAIKAAMDVAGVAAEEVAFIEAHGTGTLLGDPIEIRALARAFGPKKDGASSCAIGSVKSNIGHTQEAAGIAGLIKAALAIEHRSLPATLHVEAVNSELHLEETPFFVARQKIDWRDRERPIIAGVSSFGLGGTNAHVVLAQPPGSPEGAEVPSACLLPVSARTAQQLERLLDRLASFLERKNLPIADVAYTLQIGRKHFPYRVAVVATHAHEAASLLRAAAAQSKREQRFCHVPSVALYIPDDASSYLQQARGLYSANGAYRSEIEALLAPRPAEEAARLRDCFSSEGAVAPQGAEETPVKHIAYLALANLWRRVGVNVTAVGGRGFGDLVAAALRDGAAHAPGIAVDGVADASRGTAPTYVQGEDSISRLAGKAEIVLPVAFSASDLGRLQDPAIAPSILAVPEEGEPERRLLRTLGELWEAGCDPDWRGLHAGAAPRRVSLPTIAFNTRSFRPNILPSEASALHAGLSSAGPRQSETSDIRPRAPRGETEDYASELREIITERWVELLGLAEPPADASFFDLGGDSLLAFRLTNALRDTFDVELSARDIFENSSISQQYALIEARLLEKIETLSSDEVDSLISER